MSTPTPDVDDTTEQVLYAERPEWADVVPVAQYENIQPLAPIFYSPECTQPSVLRAPYSSICDIFCLTMVSLWITQTKTRRTISVAS